MKKELDGRVELVPLVDNLVDRVWKQRPARVFNPVEFLPLAFSGVASSEKLAAIRKELLKRKAAGLIVSALDEVACKYMVLKSLVNQGFLQGCSICEERMFP